MHLISSKRAWLVLIVLAMAGALWPGTASAVKDPVGPGTAREAPAAGSSTRPVDVPDVIVPRGGWQYSDTRRGLCGVSVIAANDLGHGSVMTRAQLYSPFGMAYGDVWILWGDRSDAVYPFPPYSPRGFNWFSPIEFIRSVPGRVMVISLFGNVYTSRGWCYIKEPEIRFRLR